MRMSRTSPPKNHTGGVDSAWFCVLRGFQNDLQRLDGQKVWSKPKLSRLPRKKRNLTTLKLKGWRGGIVPSKNVSREARTHLHTHTHTHTSTQTSTHVHPHTHTLFLTHTHTHVRARTHIYTHKHAHRNLHTHTHTHVHPHTHTHTHTRSPTHTHTHTQTHERSHKYPHSSSCTRYTFDVLTSTRAKSFAMCGELWFTLCNFFW